MTYIDRVVVITGAASGIGRSLAETYANQDAILVLIDKNEQKLLETSKRIEQSGALVKSFALDLTDTKAIENAFDGIKQLFERVDVVINNAGLGITKSIYDLTIEEWDYVLNTNLRGAFICARESAKIMRQHDGGSIINIASTRALMSEPDTFPYSASKGALLALTHSLAISLGPDKIRVNSISPGWIETGNYESLKPDDHLQHPAGRVGKPSDVAKACLYLTDHENDFVTGINLIVDGGMTHKMIYKE
jgi:NAD(P)-dependent dehydrogenase (short-subunit alcohol dehydrogenase family)